MRITLAVLGTKETTGNKADQSPCSQRSYVLVKEIDKPNK